MICVSHLAVPFWIGYDIDIFVQRPIIPLADDCSSSSVPMRFSGQRDDGAFPSSYFSTNSSLSLLYAYVLCYLVMSI
jgi:hypothetical protein